MNYSNTNIPIKIGDCVLVDYDIYGTVVCDFDSWVCLKGYESWLCKEELVGGGYLSDGGIMVETESLGFLHCRADNTIVERVT